MEEDFVPPSALEAVHRTRDNLLEVESGMNDFLHTCDVDVLADLPPLQRARAFFAIAKTLSTLFTVQLRCTGGNLDEHRLKSEIERVSLYEDKLDRLTDYTSGPSRSSATVNPQGAARVIEHSLPDLTSEQRQLMRGISRSERSENVSSGRKGTNKKRKLPMLGQQSVKAAAEEFLEKARKELLAEEFGMQGPLLNGASEDDSDD